MRIGHLRDRVGLMLATAALVGCATQPGATVSAPSPSSSIDTTASPAVQPSLAESPASSTATSPSPALTVDCTESGTTTASDSVAVQPDGVHFQVHSAAAGRSFQVDDVGGDNAPSPEGELIWPLAPGSIRIWCGPTDPTDADWVTVRVVDPAGVYVPVQLSCETAAHGSLDYGAESPGDHGDPVAITRHRLHGLRPGDVVEAAGYPARDEERKVRVTRNGKILVVATYTAAADGGWLLTGTDTCGGTDLTWGD